MQADSFSQSFPVNMGFAPETYRLHHVRIGCQLCRESPIVGQAVTLIPRDRFCPRAGKRSAALAGLPSRRPHPQPVGGPIESVSGEVAARQLKGIKQLRENAICITLSDAARFPLTRVTSQYGTKISD